MLGLQICAMMARNQTQGYMNARLAPINQLSYSPCPLAPQFLEMESYYGAQARLEFTMIPIMALDLRWLWIFLYLPNAGVTDMCHHALWPATSFLTEAMHALQTHSRANPNTTVQEMASMLLWVCLQCSPSHSGPAFKGQLCPALGGCC